MTVHDAKIAIGMLARGDNHPAAFARRGSASQYSPAVGTDRDRTFVALDGSRDCSTRGLTLMDGSANGPFAA